MSKLIIDTDPGVDDVLALTLALLTPSVDLALISLCFGNCSTQHSLRNVLSLLHVLALEQTHRNAPLLASKPRIAIGLETALDGSQLDATDFHGPDGLGNAHATAPQFSAPPAWLAHFSSPQHPPADDLPFIPSTTPSYLEILAILKNNPPNSVTILAIGPLMNIAKAAQIDPPTFARVKAVVSMGGALAVPGNVSPYAEFNVFSDALAASRVYNLTGTLDARNPAPITLDILPLDLTEQHKLLARDFAKVEAHSPHSPLLQWASIWLNQTFNTYKHMSGLADSPDSLGIQIHDPLALHYALTTYVCAEPAGIWQVAPNKDIRVETSGTWTRGMTVEDRRGKPKRSTPTQNDYSQWLTRGHGNNVGVVQQYLHPTNFGQYLLTTMFGLPQTFFSS